MPIINPWSLERLLAESHQGGASSGTVEARNEKYEVKLITSRRAEQSGFIFLDAKIRMRRSKENMFSKEQVHHLASLYGGNELLRLRLEELETGHAFFDILIQRKKTNGFSEFAMPRGEFTPRPLLRYLCKILNLRYEERENSFYLLREHKPIFTPDTITSAYHRMKKSEHFPSVSSFSLCKGFSLDQRHVSQGVDQALRIWIGNTSSKENPLPPQQILSLQKTLLEYCPALPRLDYREFE